MATCSDCGLLLVDSDGTACPQCGSKNRTVQLSGAASVAIAGSATISMRPYLSSHYLWAAEHFAALALKVECDPSRRGFDLRHRSYVVAAIFQSVAFVEALINELLKDAADNQPGYLAKVEPAILQGLAAYWDTDEGYAKILSKYQVALVVARCPPLNSGQQPYQDMALLLELRNLLVHFRPETVSSAAVQKIDKKLRGKFEIDPALKDMGNSFFPDKCLGAGCAAWSANAARTFTAEFCRRLEITPNHQQITWDRVPGDI